MKGFWQNKIILAVLTVEMLGCFIDQDVNMVAARYTSLLSFFALAAVTFPMLIKELMSGGLFGSKKGGSFSADAAAVGAGSVIALANLFIIGSNKGAFLTAADVLMASYALGKLSVSRGEKLYFGALGAAFLPWWYCTVRWYFNFNMTGMIFMLTAIMAILLMEVIRESHVYLGFVQGITYVTATLLCLLYHARCVLAGMLVMGILYLLMPILCSKKCLRILTVAAFTAGSILFTLVYMALDKLGLKVTILYKDVLSGRQLIWKELWEAFLRMPLTGIGSSYHLKSFFIFEVHNGLFDILTVHGIFVFGCVMYLLCKRLYAAMKDADTGRYSKLCLSGAFAVLFTSFFENFFINSPYLLIFLLLICCMEKKKV